MISRDVFISHASEDKDTVARPIDRALNNLGVSTWFDEASMVPGDSLTAAVGEGLAEAALVLLIITPSFIGKGWPELELRNALAQQGRTGDRKIVPLIDGDFDEVAKAYPLLQDTLAARWDGDADALAREIASRFDRRPAEWHAGTHPTAYTGPVWFRATPTAENTGTVHEITFLWDANASPPPHHSTDRRASRTGKRLPRRGPSRSASTRPRS
ncbi:toll/interleukin-1 receptor domain-containing protein [Curtobacterium sp. MCPF17_031]|uniref:toll/interleukin-1 receptor domain-containing protein n=1 Tax=Curtobacterium sp. MCPF17_031 TaxID=2175653 RepID=UPI000DA7E04D|nr:toll/interleukin-1 receptor domain-containing protein [Curtobacterium sp. MCPF17_031]PZE34251.1 hypothetical protein DEJ31_15260 [Curtobacterium sp. MCPF17_031]